MGKCCSSVPGTWGPTAWSPTTTAAWCMEPCADGVDVERNDGLCTPGHATDGCVPRDADADALCSTADVRTSDSTPHAQTTYDASSSWVCADCFSTHWRPGSISANYHAVQGARCWCMHSAERRGADSLD